VNFFGAITLLDGLRSALARGGGSAVAICSNSAGITPLEDPAVLDAMAAGDEARARALADEIHGAIIYGVTKRALARWIRGHVQEWADAGVRLNAVAPGPVDTPLYNGSREDPELAPFVDALPVPYGTISTPAQIAGIIAFLLGPDSANCHGSILFSDGGTDALLRPDAI
jgi:NAD(P)-dependent dehydrogenase (short-subunit alcohol dehydrogenase family)